MKKHLVILFAAILIAASSCQTITNPENEEKALLEVLEKEAAALVAGDMEGVFALHTQDSRETRLEMGIYGYNTYEGWDAIKLLLEDAAPGFKHPNAVNFKENIITSRWFSSRRLRVNGRFLLHPITVRRFLSSNSIAIAF